MTEKVAVAIACSSVQSSEWWSAIMAYLIQEQLNGVSLERILAVKSAVPDHNKNNAVGIPVSPMASEEYKNRNSLTDANRDAILGVSISGKNFKNGFMNSDADWLMFLDDDTVPPKNFLSHLLNLKRDFVAGLYFMPSPPHNPLAYMRNKDGMYSALYNYPMGALLQVDSVGMGCTLIHRTVFEKIMAGHEIFIRPDGSVFPVMKDTCKDKTEAKPDAKSYVKDGFFHMPIHRPEDDDTRPWPFYCLEYGRTEDHFFCELAGNVGIRPWVDTSLMCEHYKIRSVNYHHYLNALPDNLNASLTGSKE
jgi:hypothetical protein